MKVIGIDYPCLDHLVDIDRLPGTDGETEIHRQSVQGGGMVPTALAVLGRLGVDTALMGVVGDDLYGRFCAEDLRRHGVDVSRLVLDPGRTTDYTICAAERETGGRSFLVQWGDRRRLRKEELDKDAIERAEYLFLCGEMDEINLEAARIAKRAGKKVFIDADHYAPSTVEHLDCLDVVVASAFFLKKLQEGRELEKVCDEILGKGPEMVVFTLGSQGSAGKGRKEPFFRVPACRVPVVDTTGAGDVFHGAFLYGLLQNWTGAASARFAAAVAGIKCMYLGGRAGIPSLKTAKHFLETGELNHEELEERQAFYQKGLEQLLLKKEERP